MKKEYYKRYYEANKEIITKRAKEYREANKEKIAKKIKEYREVEKNMWNNQTEEEQFENMMQYVNAQLNDVHN